MHTFINAYEIRFKTNIFIQWQIYQNKIQSILLK